MASTSLASSIQGWPSALLSLAAAMFCRTTLMNLARLLQALTTRLGSLPIQLG